MLKEVRKEITSKVSKQYLQKFGYLNSKKQITKNDYEFDESLESALKTYQLNFHLKLNGMLDGPTLPNMAIPRCGVSDIINGINTMKPRNPNSTHQHLHMISGYVVNPNRLKWPSTKYNLTFVFIQRNHSYYFEHVFLILLSLNHWYGALYFNFSGDQPKAAIYQVARAFNTWQLHTQFKFTRVQYPNKADITVGSYRFNQGDGPPFDGPWNTVAHGTSPQDGTFCFDADEKWSIGQVPRTIKKTLSPEVVPGAIDEKWSAVIDPGAVSGAINLQSVALHEIGHLHGLGHSTVKESIMFPTIYAGVIKRVLSKDDIVGIRDLYSH